VINAQRILTNDSDTVNTQKTFPCVNINNKIPSLISSFESVAQPGERGPIVACDKKARLPAHRLLQQVHGMSGQGEARASWHVETPSGKKM
jgi:hypothetical protein